MIVSCGEALIDMVPDPVPGGGPMNVAIAAARLGAPAAFVGGISTDEAGEQLRAHLISNGVDVSWCERVDAPTARAIVVREPQISFRFEGDGTADTLLRWAPDLTGVDGAIVHGGTLGLFRGVTADTLADLAATHRRGGGVVSLDSNVRPQIIDDVDRWHRYHDRWLPFVDIYKGSDEDLDWVWPGRAPSDCAEQLLAEHPMSAVVVTRGGDGLDVYTADGTATVTAPTVDVVDTVGAGDTIVGALLTQIHELGVATPRSDATTRLNDRVDVATWTTIARNAVHAAAITCTRAGADVPRRDELDWSSLIRRVGPGPG